MGGGAGSCEGGCRKLVPQGCANLPRFLLELLEKKQPKKKKKKSRNIPLRSSTASPADKKRTLIALSLLLISSHSLSASRTRLTSARTKTIWVSELNALHSSMIRFADCSDRPTR